MKYYVTRLSNKSNAKGTVVFADSGRFQDLPECAHNAAVISLPKSWEVFVGSREGAARGFRLWGIRVDRLQLPLRTFLTHTFML